jgi:hypothetical protein
MKRSTIVLLAILGGFGVLVSVALFVGWRWYARNKDQIVRDSQRAKHDGTEFGHAHTGDECLTSAFARIDGCGRYGFICHAQAKFYLHACLQAAQVRKGLCDGVPPQNDIIKSATWAVAECSAHDRAGQQSCSNLLQAVQSYCQAQR